VDEVGVHIWESTFPDADKSLIGSTPIRMGEIRRHMDDISSVAFWYQTEPHAPFPALPDKDHLEVD